MKSRFFLIIGLVLTFRLFSAGPTFVIDDLSPDNQLLFSCVTRQPGWGEFTTLLHARLDAEDSMETLTFFPERSRYFPSSAEFEIQNHFGLFRFKLATGAARKLDFHPSFASGDPLKPGRVLPVAGSPDGEWIVIQEPDGPVLATLILYNVHSGEPHVLTDGIPLSYRETPVKWSPDSRYLVYSRDNRLYSLSLAQLRDNRVPDESYRDFGRGSLSTIRWAGADELYHIEGHSLRMIRPSEFFTHSFYNGPLIAGKNHGRLPVDFDPEFDEFWPSPDGRSVLLLKNQRNLFLFPLDGETAQLPFVVLPPGHTVLQIWWTASGEILLLSGGGDRRSAVDSQLYKLSGQGKDGVRFVSLEIPGVRRFAPSPDRRRLATISSEGVTIRDASSLDTLAFIPHTNPRDLFWIDSARLLVSGAHRSEILSVDDGRSSLVTLSQCDGAVFSADSVPEVKSDGRNYRYDSSAGRWVSVQGSASLSPRRKLAENKHYRVYTEKRESAAYENLVMIRRADNPGNRTLFSLPGNDGTLRRETENRNSDGPTAENRVFSHGLRSSGTEIALIFDVAGDDGGLDEVLRVLDDYGIQSTFFLGGDFIRRRPESARILAGSGHEIGSLFYTNMDVTDWRYRVDAGFVMEGLARNEDEYYTATGFEVSTFWHAPWYVVTPPILDGGEAMNYLNVGRDIDSLDWVTLDSVGETPNLYRSSSELVEHVLNEVRVGSIIPITIGTAGKREDYLFNRLDLLVNGLLEKGYDIVPVSVLREHSR